MPRCSDIHTILIPGSGPIVIGQAATAMDVPLLTTLSAAAAAVAAIRALRGKDFRYRSLQAHFAGK